MKKLQEEYTQRGFKFYQFHDRYDLLCSLQKSSLATEDAIWLGTNDNRMHLTQEQVKQLLPILRKFVRTGRI